MSCIYVSEDGMCYCEDCAPDDAAPYPFSESDSPTYCEECGDLLDESYTDYAIGYIKREIMPDLWRLIKTKGPDTLTGPPHWTIEHTARERWDELRDILYRYKSLNGTTLTF